MDNKQKLFKSLEELGFYNNDMNIHGQNIYSDGTYNFVIDEVL